jgi:hypothetical protein
MPIESVIFLEKNMESEKMVDISYRCKCGAMVTGSAAREFTPEEMAELQKRDCGVCYLKNLLEKDLQQIDNEICA